MILVASAWRHVGVLRAGFFADDYLFLDQVRRAPSLAALLTAPDPLGNFARPVGRQLYFWTLAHLGNESPALFHAANLFLFLLAIGLLFLIARRLAGTPAAAIASAVVALHYAADVTLLWGSGGQDLLALVGALGALALFLSGRRAPAAVALFLALLSKETVVLTPIVAALAGRKRDEPWRASSARAWPLGLAVAAWGALWIARLVRGAGTREAVSWSASGVAAAFAHLPQMLMGAEWRHGAGTAFLKIAPPVIPLALSLVGLLVAGRGTKRVEESSADRPATGPRAAEGPTPASSHPVLVGCAWALLGALPVAAVAPIWSAYYYLFALCGLALALGAWLAARPRWLAVGAVALLAWGSEGARRLDGFAPTHSAWSAQSHVNPFYIERATALANRYLAQLRALRPTLPPRSTLFFADLPPFIALQTADGPRVRRAYGDSSLRSYYLTSFSLEKARRGPFFFFAVVNDTLRDRSADPNLLRSFAYSMILQGKPGPARDALELLLAREPGDRISRYWLAWAQWARGDHSAALASLARSGVAPTGGPSPEIAAANAAIARRDTLGAIETLLRSRDAHGLDVDLHSRLAAICLSREESRLIGVVEAYAVTVLAPDRADGWRKLAAGQLAERQYGPAVESLRRYFLLGGAAAKQDAEAHRVLEALLSLTGGDLAQAALHRARSR